MGNTTNIEWCDATFNPWWGCVKVSPGCQHCYADTLATRYGYNIWGPAATTERRTFGEKHWAEPLKWNKAAAKEGKRARVFCASMADVFETNDAVNSERARLWDVIEATPHLDWLLLTKRPENITSMVPAVWIEQPRHNVWYGTSVENQEQATKRIPELLEVPAAVRFLSCEPLLGPVDLTTWLKFGEFRPYWPRPIHWVIAGGESGRGARPMHPDWARGLRDQCQAAGIAFHFKQWGEYKEIGPQHPRGKPFPPTSKIVLRSGDPHNPEWTAVGGAIMDRVGKHRAGRVLDGRTWDEFPEVTV